MLINKDQWLQKVKYWKKIWPQIGLDEYKDDSNGINLYKFIEILNKNLKNDSVLVSDAGSAAYVLGQSLELKEGQRWILDGGQMGMGAWQSSIGVCLARDNRDVLTITGDGSFMCGIESLAVIKKHNLRIKFFIWCNNGYLSIRNTQQTFYNNRLFGTDKEHGIYFPDLDKIANSYELNYIKIDNIKNLEDNIDYIMNLDRAIICEIKCDPNQKIIPTLSMKDGKAQPFYNMYPFIEDIEKEMIKL